MVARVLVTGGAGFIGSHLTDELLAGGYDVTVLDNCSPQVHGGADGAPGYLSSEARFVEGDVRDAAALERALEGVEAVVHLAAAVGVGQSMYQIADYVSANDLGTATLLQLLSARPPRKLVIASSMSIYGEGRYRGRDGKPVDDVVRSGAEVRRGQWDPRDRDGNGLIPVATPESKQPTLSSVYALTKYAQERMALLVGEAYGISTVALRFFNVFGSRQALSNPYTGVLAIFASRLLNGRRPLVYEDGNQRRDFVHVSDVARACRLALEAPPESDGVYNIGSGSSITVREVGQHLADALGRRDLVPEITGRFRVGDIRHCFADITLARERLGYEPWMTFERGLEELTDWLAGEIAVDRLEEANDELSRRGLVA